MTLDQELLKKAKGAAATLAEAEKDADLARAEYHTSIRRLHLAAGSLREVAEALGISHQRVQQIVEGAGGSWWKRVWKGRSTVRRDTVCTFCERPPSEVGSLLAGPNIFICDSCVEGAERARDGGSVKSWKSQGPGRCSFCSKTRKPMYASKAGQLCGDCLGVCRQILTERRPWVPPPSR